MPNFVYNDYRNQAGTAFVYRTAVQGGPVLTSINCASFVRVETDRLRSAFYSCEINIAPSANPEEQLGPPVSITYGGALLSWTDYTQGAQGVTEIVLTGGQKPALQWGQSYDLIVTDGEGKTASISLPYAEENTDYNNYWGYVDPVSYPDAAANDSFQELALTDSAFVGYAPANVIQVQFEQGFNVNGSAIDTPYNLTVDDQGRPFINPYSEITGRKYRLLYTDSADSNITRYIEGEFNFRAQDLTPEITAGTFSDVVDVLASQLITSAAQSPANYWGISEDVPITIINGEYSVDGEAFTTAAGVIHPSDSLQLRVTSAPTYPGSNVVTITLGTTPNQASYDWTVTNYAESPDNVPDAIVFTSLVDVDPFTQHTPASEFVTLSGFNTPLTLTNTNPRPDLDQYYSNPLAPQSGWTGTAETPVTLIRYIPPEYVADFLSGSYQGFPLMPSTTTLTVRVGGMLNVSSMYSRQYIDHEQLFGQPFTNTDLTLENHGVITFSGTFEAADTTPDTFSFGNVTEATTSTLYVFPATVVISGVDAGVDVPIYVDGTSNTTVEYSVDGGAYTEQAGNVRLSQSVTMRALSSASDATPLTAALNIGGEVGSSTITTAATVDTTPDSFSIPDVANAPQSTTHISDPVTIAGINAATSITIVDGEYSIDGGDWLTVAGVVTEGQTFRVRIMSSSELATAVSTTVNVGGISATYTVTTGSISLQDITPSLITVSII